MKRYRVVNQINADKYGILEYELGEMQEISKKNYNKLIEEGSIDCPEAGGMYWNFEVAYKNGELNEVAQTQSIGRAMTMPEAQVLCYSDFGMPNEIREVVVTQYGVVNKEAEDTQHIDKELWIDNERLSKLRKFNTMAQLIGTPIELKLNILNDKLSIKLLEYDGELEIKLDIPDGVKEIKSEGGRGKKV